MESRERCMTDTERRERWREAGRKGGQVTLARHGVEHFRRIQALSWQAQVERDPNAHMRLGYAGLRSMDPVPANRIWTEADGSAKYQQQRVEDTE
jgi:general stress protein YciG